MTHFGVICPAAIGHSNPMVALAAELMQRGHRCTFFQVADWEKELRKRGADFQAIGVREFPLGAWPALLERLGRTEGRKLEAHHPDVLPRAGGHLPRRSHGRQAVGD